MYVEVSGLIARFGEQELIQLTDRASTGVIVTSVAERAIADATAEIDGYLRAGGYTVPLSPAPELLERIAADIARFHLYDDQATEEVRKRYEDQVALLRRIASGDVRLGVGEGDGAGSAEVAASERVFTRDGLRDFG